MRIASYNIRKAVGLDWRRDPERIADVLAEIDADLVVLQECDKRVGTRAGVLDLDYLEKELGYELADVSIRPDSHGWHGNAILYRDPSQFRRASRVVLPCLEPRGAVSLQLETPALEVVGVHLGLDPRTRRLQLEALGQYLQNLTHPVVIAGDFNMWRAKEAMQSALNTDCRIILPGKSYHSARPNAAFDRFILGNLPAPRRAFVHRSSLARRASDHLPIVVDLNLPEPAA